MRLRRTVPERFREPAKAHSVSNSVSSPPFSGETSPWRASNDLTCERVVAQRAVPVAGEAATSTEVDGAWQFHDCDAIRSRRWSTQQYSGLAAYRGVPSAPVSPRTAHPPQDHFELSDVLPMSYVILTLQDGVMPLARAPFFIWLREVCAHKTTAQPYTALNRQLMSQIPAENRLLHWNG